MTDYQSVLPADPRLQAQLPSVYEPLFFTQIDSVVAEVKRRSQTGVDEGLLVWAGEQSAGHGQHGPWESPAGGLYCAVLLRPDFAHSHWPEMGLVAMLALGTSVAELLPPLTGLDYRWPNDVLVNGHKVGGISLTQSAEALVVGAQLNIVPPIQGWQYASLVDDAAALATPGEALSGYARHFIDTLQRWNDQGLESIRHSLRARGMAEVDEQGGRLGDEPQSLDAFFALERVD